jgi:hypothetical protein
LISMSTAILVKRGNFQYRDDSNHSMRQVELLLKQSKTVLTLYHHTEKRRASVSQLKRTAYR